MTPGKIADNKMPFEQMDVFKKLAESENQPIGLNYKGQKILVQFEKPLLFNFGVNAQTFTPPLSIRSFEENNKRNDESFRNLFGNFKIFGGENSNQKIEGHYSFDENSIIGKRLNDNTLKEDTKKQIQSLADQIIDIYSENKRGIGENPYALPSRVTLLTNLLGYATSYGCKSGKDRTGLMSMELENLTAKVLTDNEPYDPYNQSVAEKQNLQSIYKAGCSIEIAKVNTGDVQNKLKIKQFGVLFTSNEKRFGVNVNKEFDSNLEKLNTNRSSIDSVSYNSETLSKIEENVTSNKLKDFSLEEKLSWITSNLDVGLKITVLDDLKSNNNFLKTINNNVGLQKYIESNILTPSYKQFSNKNNFYDANVYQGMPALKTSHYQNAQKLLSVYTNIASNEFKSQNQKDFENLKSTLESIDNINSIEQLVEFLKA